MTSADYWPLTGLRLRTADLELRLPAAEDLLAALAGLAETGFGWIGRPGSRTGELTSRLAALSRVCRCSG